MPASPRPPVKRAKRAAVRLPTSVHDPRNRCSTSSGFDVPLPGFRVPLPGIDIPLPPESAFHFVRITQAICPSSLWRALHKEESQIDWGQARVWLGAQRQVRHIFVPTLGYSRRSVYVPCLTEALGELLDAHEQAFTHFGGHTQEHLYDRPRTVCVPRGADGVRWNTTFKAFADFWGFEPRLCRAYRAQTKGKVESGVKYFKRNFLAGRRFRDDLDFNEQLQEWTATVADVRVHGTTHERPIDRFARERDGLVPAVAGRAFRLEAPLTRVVATDYLVTVDTNRYSVPFTLIGQPVEVMRRDGFLQMRHRGQVVATHPVLGGRHQLRILPEHGPGPIARNARVRYSTGGCSTEAVPLDVEIRDLACYEAAYGLGGAR